MNKLADAVWPEADDEFSYREDAGVAAMRDVMKAVVGAERHRNPLMPVANPYADADRRFLARHRSPREPGLLPPVFQRNPVTPLPAPRIYQPDRFETRDSAPLPKRVAPKMPVLPPTQCPICRVLSAVLGKMPGRRS